MLKQGEVADMFLADLYEHLTTPKCPIYRNLEEFKAGIESRSPPICHDLSYESQR